MPTNRFTKLAIPLLLLGLAPALAAVDDGTIAEDKVPDPPAFSINRVLTLEMPSFVTVKMGVDPQTIRLGRDGVIRYVVVIRNPSGGVSALYEGLHCATGQVKTYARSNAGGDWTPVAQPEWKDMAGSLPSRHAFAFARQGACDVATPRPEDAIVRSLSRQGRIAY